jgi:hypothetical protein
MVASSLAGLVLQGRTGEWLRRRSGCALNKPKTSQGVRANPASRQPQAQWLAVMFRKQLHLRVISFRQCYFFPAMV